MHLKNSVLRMMLDQELPLDELHQAEAHLSACGECRQRLAEIKTRQEQVHAVFSVLEPNPREALPTESTALSRLALREKEAYPMSAMKIRRPVWVLVVLTVVFAAAFTFPPVRAFASELLAFFRVEEVTTIPLDTFSLKDLPTDPTLVEAIGELFSESVSVVEGNPEDYQLVVDAQSASDAAGFEVRLPVGVDAPEEIRVDQSFTFDIQLDGTSAQQVVDQFGMADVELPAELDGAVIEVSIPNRVSAKYGSCPDDSEDEHKEWNWECIIFSQSPSPVVSAPSDLDPALLAEIGLQILGVSPEEAAAFSQSADWTTTLTIPIPRGDVEYREVQVDGVTGSLFERPTSGDPDEMRGYTLVWLKDGMIYSIVGGDTQTKALELAESLP